MEKSHHSVQASVIIPVYNAEKTLPECLDSILSQTLTEFEVICIDDGSSDRSWEVLCAYAKKDPRIHIVKQENSGPGVTRNHGIELAKGEYLFFVDADDYVKPDFLETVCGIGQKQNADIVLFDGDRFDTTTRKRIFTRHFLRKDLLPENMEVFSLQDCPEVIFQITAPTGWARAYKRAMVEKEQLRYSDYPNSEDLFFSYTGMAAAKRIAFTTQKFYMYRIGQSANVESGKGKAPLCAIEAYLALAHWLEERMLLESCKKSFGIRFFESVVHSVKTISSEASRQAICQRLLAEDIAQLHLLDQSDAFYHNNLAVRQVRCLLQSFQREPILQPKVSVIIPVYNVEKYLVDCLESLLNQTMPDFEVICIDDGSDDGSSEILKFYSRLDNRIKVIFGAHQGAAAARNQGIDLAVGEYLYFMDSDDLAVDTLLEKTYAAAVKTNADVVAFDIYMLNMQNGMREEPKYCFRPFNAPVEKSTFSLVDAADHIFQISNPSPWTKIVRREFVLKKKLRYQNLQNTNDAYFAHMVMALAERITLVNERLYIYRVGLVNNIQNNKEVHPECVVEAYMSIYDRLVKERIWTLCEKSWIAEFLAVICFTLKTIKTRAAYKRLYKRICELDVVNTGYLEHEESYYPEHYHYELVRKFLSSSIKFTDSNERDTKVLISGYVHDPVVSVIIPVYNVEDYLTECLDSIRNQTLKNIEIICVDDGSSDNSLRILCQAAKDDHRISVLTQKNAGQSAARNLGIQFAHGQYLYYIDSDDLLELNALQFLVETMDDNGLDCILFGGKTFFETDILHSEQKSYENHYCYKSACDKLMPGLDLFTILHNTSEFRASVCMQMVSTELIRNNQMSFYDGILHEDELYTLELMLHSKRCMALSDQFYLRRIREGSTVTSGGSISRLVGYVVCFSESIRLMEQFSLSGPQYDAVYQMQSRLVWGIRKNYSAISGDERLWAYAFFTGPQKCIYNTLVQYFNSVKTNGGNATALQDRRLNDHDTALRYAQEELAQNRTRLDDHDTALGYAQEELAQNRTRLNDHDTALRYAQEELAQNRTRIKNLDAAVGYLQADNVEMQSVIAQMRQSPGRRLGRALIRVPRKLKSLFK